MLALTFEDPCDPASLHLRLGHDGSQCVDETHHRQRWMLHVGREHVLVESHAVAAPVQAVLRQVREVVVVAGGKHDCVYLWDCGQGLMNLFSDLIYFGEMKRRLYLINCGPVRKSHCGAADLGHIWLDDDRPGQDFQRQVIVNHWDFTEQSGAERDRHSRLTADNQWGGFLRAELSHCSPVIGLEGVHGVIIHGVQFVLAVPVKEVDWQKLEQNVDEAGVVLHVHR